MFVFRLSESRAPTAASRSPPGEPCATKEPRIGEQKGVSWALYGCDALSSRKKEPARPTSVPDQFNGPLWRASVASDEDGLALLPAPCPASQGAASEHTISRGSRLSASLQDDSQRPCPLLDVPRVPESDDITRTANERRAQYVVDTARVDNSPRSDKKSPSIRTR